ncbi:MAG: M28 family peptidase [Bdellovibrionota bacterium]
MKTKTLRYSGVAFLLATASPSFASQALMPVRTPAIVSSEILDLLGIPAEKSDKALGLSYAELRPEQAAAIGHYMHANGRCGGFEALAASIESDAAFAELMQPLKKAETSRALFATHLTSLNAAPVVARQDLLQAFDDVSAEKQQAWVQFLSSFPSRYHNTSDPNVHVRAIQARLEEIAKTSKLPITIELISHQRTPQKSIRARILGSKRPTEIVVIGGHLDSISGWFGREAAPGADDNASGSANILESFRLLSQMAQPDRTIEFYWYAAEEIGLVGSAEIARDAKAANKDIVGALQLDMTLHPGDGPFTLASMEDFTSPWLRDLLVQINSAYALGAKIVGDKCNYGCSDHASWYQNGYPTVMPFESSFDNMNHEIHTPRDVINSASNFQHSALFTKIAMAFAWELANSDRREPKL